MSSAHILLVEDDTNLAFVIKDNLELAGFTITHCASVYLGNQRFFLQ